MVFDNQENKDINNIGEIVNEGLKKPIVRRFCVQGKNQNPEEIKNKQSEFSRFLGFCILFKISEISLLVNPMF